MAAKRKGRKRKVVAIREPNGRALRKTPAELAREARSVGVEARQRVFRLDKLKAEKEEAGSAVGRAYLNRELAPNNTGQNRRMFEAARLYERVYRDEQWARDQKRPRSASDYSGAGGHDGWDYDIERRDNPSAEYVSFEADCQRKIRAYQDSRRALLDADPFAQLAVDAWVIEGKEAWGLLGELRVGLNALERLYRVEEWAAEEEEAA